MIKLTQEQELIQRRILSLPHCCGPVSLYRLLPWLFDYDSLIDRFYKFCDKGWPNGPVHWHEINKVLLDAYLINRYSNDDGNGILRLETYDKENEYVPLSKYFTPHKYDSMVIIGGHYLCIGGDGKAYDMGGIHTLDASNNTRVYASWNIDHWIIKHKYGLYGELI